MRRILMLFAVVLSTLGMEAQGISVSVSEVTPEHVYTIKSKNGYWMTSHTSPTATQGYAAQFAFFAVEGKTDTYRIQCVDTKRWLSYTKASGYNNGTNFVYFEETKDDAEYWEASYNESKGAFQFAPYNNTGVASKYLNWYQGIYTNPLDNATTTVGLWQGDAASDNGSAWVIEEVDNPVIPKVVTSLEELRNDKVYMLKSGRSAQDGEKHTTHYLLYHSDAPSNLSSTYSGEGHTMLYSTANTNFQFVIHKHTDGKYYFYNVGAGKFIGNANGNNAAIPLTVVPSNAVQMRSSQNTSYNFVLSTNGTGALNLADRYGCNGVVNWTGGYNNLTDLGNVYQILEVGDLAVNLQSVVSNTFGFNAEDYFQDPLLTQLKDGVTSSEGIANAELKALVDNLLSDADGYKKFRVAEYEPYRTVASLQQELKTSAPYNQWENPTGIYLKEGESCVVAVSGIGSDPVGLKIKNWVENEDGSSYPLQNGLNRITATTEGNVFVDYYTDNYEKAPNVQIHFINAPVRGYWDQQTMTNKVWKEMLDKLPNDNSIIIVRSQHAQLAFPVSAWKQYCPENVDALMTLYQQTQWAQRNMMGLEKYNRQTKNRQLFYANKSGLMAAGWNGAYCNISSLRGIMTPDATQFDFWGVGHEWGHNNQIKGFHWSGCGETTNNIYASWGQLLFTGNPNNLRLEDEYTGIDEYAGMRGGRMQVYFEEGIRKGIPWQLWDGPDYHNATPESVTVQDYDYDGNAQNEVQTTKRNYDHFVKLAPFWQLNLWGTKAEKCPDIIPMVIESIRTTENYTTTYNTNGKQQINWMKLACDNAQLNLLPFFEKAGMLKPINAYIEDYGAGWNKISEEMINELKAYVASQGYAEITEEVNYINGHNYHIYRDKLKLEVPSVYGTSCEMLAGKVKVLHSIVKNAVAFETYDSDNQLVRITMYGLGSDDKHSYTQVLFPADAAYIMAVGYDGERKKVYDVKDIWPLADKVCFLQSGTNYFMNAYTAPTLTNMGLFQFIPDVSKGVNAYKIKSVDSNKWVSYEIAGGYSNGMNKAKLVDDQSKVNSWYVYEYATGLYEISPFQSNGTKANIYWNWYGGVTSDKYVLDGAGQTIGFYSTAGNNDSGSRWKIIFASCPEGGKFYRLRCLDGGKYLSSIISNERLEMSTQADANTVFMYDATEDATGILSYTKGVYIETHTLNAVGVKTNVEFTSVADNAVYKINVGERYIYGKGDTKNNHIDSSMEANSTGYYWTLEEVASLPFTFKAAAFGYATFNAPVAVQLPEGVKAYVSEIMEGNKLKMTELADGVVPANTAVLLWNESVADKDVTVNLTIVENVIFEGTNSFVGTVAAENLKAGIDYYSLQKGTKGKVGFYEKSTGTKGGFKAWIEMAKTGEARAFTIIFDGEDATGIKEALGLENENVEIYDLSGRRLDKPAKGVNIIGGKTVIVR